LHVWSTIFNGLAIACLGLSAVFLAIRLRGPEEKGWNALMAVGSLLTAIGVLSIPALAIWYAIK
jgi:CHASE2 domain-containing sensor protein